MHLLIQSRGQTYGILSRPAVRGADVKAPHRDECHCPISAYGTRLSTIGLFLELSKRLSNEEVTERIVYFFSKSSNNSSSSSGSSNRSATTNYFSASGGHSVAPTALSSSSSASSNPVSSAKLVAKASTTTAMTALSVASQNSASTNAQLQVISQDEYGAENDFYK